MTEGWEDCRLLGPGWKRREVFRKSGATCGRTDTYYQSPTGEKFRSKVEMMKYLGSSVDLTLFDFKNGMLMAPEEVQSRKRKRSVGSSQEPKAKIPKMPVPVPAPPDGVSTTSPDGTMVVCCEGCKAWFSGVMFGKQKLIRWFCGDCKAERRAFMKEQRFYKTVGCGMCSACQLPEDCAACTVCLLRAQNPEFGTMWKCVKRRCLKIVKKKWNPPSEQDVNIVPTEKAKVKPKIKPKKLTPHPQQATALRATVPQATTPQITAPQATTLQVTAPQATTPQVTALHATTPQVTTQGSAQKDTGTGPMLKYKKKNGCGMCQPCRVTEDCGACWTCVKKRTDPGRKMKRQWKCAKRRCLRKKKIQQKCQQKLQLRIPPPETKTFVPKEQTNVVPKQQTHFVPQNTHYPPKETHFVVKEKPHFVPKTMTFVPKEKTSFVPKEKTSFVPKEKTSFVPKEKTSFVPEETHVPKERTPFFLKEKSHFIPKEKKSFVTKDKKGFVTKKLTVKWKLPFERERDSSSLQMAKLKKKQQLRSKANEQKMNLKRHLSNRRKNRKCGECEACVQKVDCGRCDFCRDKPKFGGRNLKRQKCRWRQCLRFAMEKNIPAVLKRIKQEKGEGLSHERNDELSESSSDQEYDANGFSSDQSFSSDSTKHVKQEKVDTNGTCDETLPMSLVHKDHPLPSNIDEVLIEGNMAEADESTPVIMEIFSLGSYQAFSRLDTVLREFLNELNDIPLPAHWEVLPLDSPNLQLVQRSKQSTMADTIIHIQPGLYFQITVRDLYVPSSHELYSNHPCRLTTVDDVVELICDLEAYRLCTGPPKNTPRTPDCEILVYEGRCPQCSLRPWPSGADL